MECQPSQVKREQIMELDCSSTEEDGEIRLVSDLYDLFGQLVEAWLETNCKNAFAEAILNKKCNELNKSNAKKRRVR